MSQAVGSCAWQPVYRKHDGYQPGSKVQVHHPQRPRRRVKSTIRLRGVQVQTDAACSRAVISFNPCLKAYNTRLYQKLTTHAMTRALGRTT